MFSLWQRKSFLCSVALAAPRPSVTQLRQVLLGGNAKHGHMGREQPHMEAPSMTRCPKSTQRKQSRNSCHLSQPLTSGRVGGTADPSATPMGSSISHSWVIFQHCTFAPSTTLQQ